MLLIRHAQSEFNIVFSVSRQDPGIRDPRLTEEGRRQAREAADLLLGEGLRRLVSSPYTRALETAEIIAERLAVPITVDPRIGERAAFSCDVGSTAALLRERWPRLSLGHLAEEWWPALEESEEAVARRSREFAASAAGLEDWAAVGVVTHWGFIRALTGLPVTNTAILRIDPRQPRTAPTVLRMPPRLSEKPPGPA